MKIATDFEQSKKLAEFLPLESADMCWTPFDEKWDAYLGTPNPDAIKKEIPCWSLAALINLLPNDEENSSVLSRGVWTNDEYESKWCAEWEYHGKDDYHHELAYSYEPIDACVELTIKIHERNLI